MTTQELETRLSGCSAEYKSGYLDGRIEALKEQMEKLKTES